MNLFGWFRPKPKGLAYEGASTGRRFIKWHPSTVSINAALFAEGDVLRARSRDLVRRNAYAHNAVEALVANAVGTGIKPQPAMKSPDQRKKVQKLWLAWTDEADADNVTDFYGLQTLICRAMLEGGECLVRFRPRRPEDGLSVPLQLQVLEAEHLATHHITPVNQGNVVRGGIEFNAIGQRVYYHLYRTHPGETTATHEIVAVPASEVLHIYKPLRPGQIRGEPWLARIIARLDSLDKYDDAELKRKEVAAMFAAFVTKPDGTGEPTFGEGAANEQGVAEAGMEPGTMQYLAPGESIEFAEPADVGGNYEPFLKQNLRYVAVAMGVTYEQLTGDLKSVNYSSIRAGLLEFRRRIEGLQHHVLVFQLCRPIYNRWFELAVLSGALSIQPGAFNARRREYLAVKWIPQGWDWVDPLKDIQAMQMAIRCGLMSRSEAVSGTGGDSETVDEENFEDNKRADKYGIVYDTDPRKTAKTGAVQAPTNEPQEATE